MTTDEFNNIITKQLDLCKRVLIEKSVEYNKDKDERLDCFKAAAKLTGVALKEAVAGMMIKHTVSIYQMISDGKHYSQEKWDEKITDHINYLLILKAAVMEEDAKRKEGCRYEENSN